MKRTMFCVAMVALIAPVGIAWAGDPAFTYEIPHIPDELLPEVDGALDDAVWAAFPMEFAWVHPGGDLPLSDGRGIGNVTPDASNFSATVKAGWNNTTNKFYMAIVEFDDVWYGDSGGGWWFDDAWHMFTDGAVINDWFQYSDQLPEDEWGARAQHWEWFVGEHWWGRDSNMNIEQPKTNVAPSEEPFAKVEFGGPAPANGDQNVTIETEMYFSFWEYVHPTDNSESITWDLEAGQTVGWQFMRYEDDEGGDVLNAEWQTGGSYVNFNSATFAEAFLLGPEDVEWPTAVESSTWARIKASF